MADKANLFPKDPRTFVLADGDELPGFIVYGFWPTPDVNFEDTELKKNFRPDYLRTGYLHGDGWTISCTDIGYKEETAYVVNIQTSAAALDVALKQDAKVAWIGSEASPLLDPPWLFSPTEMAGSVLLAKPAGADLMRPDVSPSGSGARAAISTADMQSLNRLVRDSLRR